MRYSFLALGFAFVALGFTFSANAKSQEGDAAAKSRFASKMFLIAATGFVFAFAISFLAGAH